MLVQARMCILQFSFMLQSTKNHTVIIMRHELFQKFFFGWLGGGGRGKLKIMEEKLPPSLPPHIRTLDRTLDRAIYRYLVPTIIVACMTQ